MLPPAPAHAAAGGDCGLPLSCTVSLPPLQKASGGTSLAPARCLQSLPKSAHILGPHRAALAEPALADLKITSWDYKHRSENARHTPLFLPCFLQPFPCFVTLIIVSWYGGKDIQVGGQLSLSAGWAGRGEERSMSFLGALAALP